MTGGLTDRRTNGLTVSLTYWQTDRLEDQQTGKMNITYMTPTLRPSRNVLIHPITQPSKDANFCTCFQGLVKIRKILVTVVVYLLSVKLNTLVFYA